MRRKRTRFLGAAAIALGVLFLFAAPANAHDIVSASGVCTSPNSATFSFTFTNFGSESRYVKIYNGGVLIGDEEAQTGDGVHTYTITDIDTGNGNQANVQFHFESDAVVNTSHDISVDFTLCQPTTTTGATTTAATTTVCDSENGRECETTTTATTIATTTTATTLPTTTTTGATTTAPFVTNPCPGSGCPTTTLATTTSASTTAATTTTASTAATTVPDTSAVDQTLAPVPAPAQPTVTPTMPVTGGNDAPLAAAGVILILAGAAGVALERRK